MSSAASRDGVLVVHPGNQQELALKHGPGTLPLEFVEQLEAGGDLGKLQLFARSVLGQMGVNIVPNGDPILDKKGKAVTAYSPVAVTAHSPLGEMVMEDFDEMREARKEGAPLRLRRKASVIEAGRYVDLSQYTPMTQAETQNAFNTCLLAIDIPHTSEERQYQINEDGSVTMPIALVETLISSNTLRSREERLNAIKHGRAGLIPHTDTIRRNENDIVPPFLLGGIALSPGPFTCVIREALDEKGNTKQLSGAALIDGNRLMGIGRDLDLYTGHRQIEVTNLDEALTFGAAKVTIDIYRYSGDAPDLNPVINWYGMHVDQRKKLHNQGVNPLDVIHVAEPAARDHLKNSYAGEAGVILSSHGGTIVPKDKTDLLTTKSIIVAAKSFGRNRELPKSLKSLEPFIEELAPAGDRSRVFIGERLLLEHMQSVVESGDVRSFFVEDWGEEFMQQKVHTAVMEMVRSGVSIGWDDGAKIRNFHRSGFWMTREAIDRFENLRMVIAMYGTHRPSVDQALEPKVQEFFELLTDLMPVEYLAVTHGNGPGVMRMSDVLAREAGIMSLGVGIKVEGQEEGENIWLPEGAVQFLNSERLYRQQLMDKLRMIAILNLGGYGTLEEAAISLCTTKLNSTIPAPAILVDPTGEYYKPVVEQFRKASEEKELVIDGEKIDIIDTPFGQPWVTNTVHIVRDYTEAYEIIDKFWKNPAEYWEEAGIPPKEVAKAYWAQFEEWIKMGMKMPERVTRAVREYAPEHMLELATS